MLVVILRRTEVDVRCEVATAAAKHSLIRAGRDLKLGIGLFAVVSAGMKRVPAELGTGRSGRIQPRYRRAKLLSWSRSRAPATHMGTLQLCRCSCACPPRARAAEIRSVVHAGHTGHLWIALRAPYQAAFHDGCQAGFTAQQPTRPPPISADSHQAPWPFTREDSWG